MAKTNPESERTWELLHASFDPMGESSPTLPALHPLVAFLYIEQITDERNETTSADIATVSPLLYRNANTHDQDLVDKVPIYGNEEFHLGRGIDSRFDYLIPNYHFHDNLP
jgi:hypothetical protein